MTAALWIVQSLLALLFFFAGGMKLVLPLEQLTGPITLPGPLLRFIGVAEVLGALGLILRAPAHSAGPDTVGRCRAGGHHDRCDGAHAGGRGCRGGADLADRRAPRCVRRDQ